MLSGALAERTGAGTSIAITTTVTLLAGMASSRVDIPVLRHLRHLDVDGAPRTRLLTPVDL